MGTPQDHDRWMARALALARLGAGQVAPNPMVGAVLVKDGKILSEGWHHAFGGPHAEVDCLRALGDQRIPDDATMYVSMEPCSHHGKTPPCIDLLIERGVRHLVAAHEDPNPLVAGRGFARARAAGIDVVTGPGRDEARWLNRRFLTFHEKGRPYIILKWARSADGFLDRYPRPHREVHRISSPATDVLVHQWRSEEQAILVGSRTVLNDDPQLTVRHVAGRSPLRVVIDRKGIVPDTSKIFDKSASSLLLTDAKRAGTTADMFLVDPTADPIDALLTELKRRGMISLLVEGGSELLSHFIGRGLWDEARVITGAQNFGSGTPAPMIQAGPFRTFTSSEDRVDLYVNDVTPDLAWVW